MMEKSCSIDNPAVDFGEVKVIVNGGHPHLDPQIDAQRRILTYRGSHILTASIQWKHRPAWVRCHFHDGTYGNRVVKRKLEPGGTDEAELLFTLEPHELAKCPGSQSGIIWLRTNAEDTPDIVIEVLISVNVSRLPTPVILPQSIDFGCIRCGERKEISAIIFNDGTEPLSGSVTGGPEWLSVQEQTVQVAPESFCHLKLSAHIEDKLTSRDTELTLDEILQLKFDSPCVRRELSLPLSATVPPNFSKPMFQLLKGQDEDIETQKRQSQHLKPPMSPTSRLQVFPQVLVYRNTVQAILVIFGGILIVAAIWLLISLTI